MVRFGNEDRYVCARRCKGRGDARIDELSGYVCMCMYGRMDGWMDGCARCSKRAMETRGFPI